MHCTRFSVKKKMGKNVERFATEDGLKLNNRFRSHRRNSKKRKKMSARAQRNRARALETIFARYDVRNQNCAFVKHQLNKSDEWKPPKKYRFWGRILSFLFLSKGFDVVRNFLLPTYRGICKERPVKFVPALIL